MPADIQIIAIAGYNDKLKNITREIFKKGLGQWTEVAAGRVEGVPGEEGEGNQPAKQLQKVALTEQSGFARQSNHSPNPLRA